MLSGAGLIKSKSDESKQVHVHVTTPTFASATGEIDLTDALGGDALCEDAPIFVVKTEADGSITGEVVSCTVDEGKKKLKATGIESQTSVLVDYYVVKKGEVISELQIDAENFAGYYYVEASTLFRRQSDGVDMPAEITLPNVKIQSNFTFSMAATGDPSTLNVGVAA